MRKITGNSIEKTKEVSRSRDALKNLPWEKLRKKMERNIGGSKATLR